MLTWRGIAAELKSHRVRLLQANVIALLAVAAAVPLPLLLPLMLSVALFLFLRGHNLPGGGFSAGLVAATGMLLLYLSRGTDWVDARWQPDQQRVIGA